MEFCEQLALEGLRTLVFGQKVLKQDEADNFLNAYDRARNNMGNRNNEIINAMKIIEHDIDFLGVSGVEDKL